MILSFKTQINGKPTYFVEKIWSSLLSVDEELYEDYLHPDGLPSQMPWPTSKYKDFAPKHHTIRKDEKNRWKPGMDIDFFINARQKNMFRFAPRIPLISRQRVFMTYMPHYGNGFEVSINGRQLGDDEILTLAINDGFDTVEEFEDYFISEMEDDQYSGLILHWTNFKY
ncbi:MAG: hypothetical protein L6264_07430 [Weeksellaceae bacterium]|nr:hypothetical protein [Bacteroidota bacterium]MCG2780765.1 hypothetical protein [Weeksellaceae bacterium]